MLFEPGDIIEITSVTEDDKLRGVYVGETGVVQPLDYDTELEGGTLIVLLNDHNWSYYVYESQIRKVSSATLDSIFRAYNVNDEKLLTRVKSFVEKTLNTERSLFHD